MSDALDLIPPQPAAVIDNVVVLVADRNADEADLLGLYEGVALTERDSNYAGSLPDTITIYRDALLEVCDDEDEVVEEVKSHRGSRIAHHFGIDDDGCTNWAGPSTLTSGPAGPLRNRASNCRARHR